MSGSSEEPDEWERRFEGPTKYGGNRGKNTCRHCYKTMGLFEGDPQFSQETWGGNVCLHEWSGWDLWLVIQEGEEACNLFSTQD